MQVNKAYTQYAGTLISQERIRELSELRPQRAVRDCLIAWLWIVAAWILVAVFPTWWTVLIAIPIIGTRYYALFIIAHDGLHRRLFPKRQQNDLFNDLFILGSIGAITRINNQNHLKHHLYLATDDDPDRHKHACFNKTEFNELLVYMTGLGTIFKAVWNVYVKPQLRRTDKPQAAMTKAKKESYTPRDLLILAGWQIGLLVGLTVFVAWWAYPVLWLFPVYVFTYLGDNLRSFIEHSHPEADQVADKHRLITHVSNPVERIFLAPMNMNFHAAHHLYPSIPYYNLPTADAELRRLPNTEGLEWRKSYLGYLWRYYMALPLEECKLEIANEATHA